MALRRVKRKADEQIGRGRDGGATAIGDVTTRKSHPRCGRIATRIENGLRFERPGAPRPNCEKDRVMIYGSMDMLKDSKALCEAHGLTEGANYRPAEFVVERAFVD